MSNTKTMTPTPDNSSSWIDHSHNHQHESHENHTCHCDDDVTASNNIIMEEADQTNVLMRLKAATFLCCAFLLLEIVGGAVAGSLAVLSDAAHRATGMHASCCIRVFNSSEINLTNTL